MMKIYKYYINTNDSVHSIEMPMFAEILSIGVIGANICICAAFEPRFENNTETRKFILVEESLDVPTDITFLGTCIFDGEFPLVLHVFEHNWR